MLCKPTHGRTAVAVSFGPEGIGVWSAAAGTISDHDLGM
jgi:hypothetical protein